MTIEEAIETIQYALAFNSDNSPLTRALEMAISALRAQQEAEKNAYILCEIIWQLESCGYECEAGPLSLNDDFLRHKETAYLRPPGKEA